jgi:hypothetical protein
MSGQKTQAARDTRFKLGQSGNPKGRPKKQEPRYQINEDGFRHTFLYQMMQPVKVKIDGKPIKIPTFAAIVQVQVQKALAGNRLAAKWLTDTFHLLVHDNDEWQAFFADISSQRTKAIDEEWSTGKRVDIFVPEPPETGPASQRRRSRKRV